MIWKEFLKDTAGELAEYLSRDIQYSRIPRGQIRQIAWREIELFIENYKKWSPETLVLKEQSKISDKDKARLKSFIKARIKGKPLAYIIGKQRFYGLDIGVNKNVLIPRPETEELVRYAIKRIKNNSILVDMGTGSGCILAAILSDLPKNMKLAGVFAIDKSRAALKLAKKNLKKFRINYISSSLFPIILRNDTDRKIIIVANLPYLSEKEYLKLSPEVKQYEPKTALVGGKQGHELICKLIDQTVGKINNFEMFLEISPTIYPKIKKHLAGKDVRYAVKRDLSGKIRILHISSSAGRVTVF